MERTTGVSAWADWAGAAADSDRPTRYTMSYPHPPDRAEEGWPWNCTGCGTTVYHEGRVCSDCEREARAEAGADTRWLGERSLPRLAAGVCTAVLLVLL